MQDKYQILQKQFGFKEFRALQEEAIDAIIQKQDLLMILPTGGGKSLSFQLPTLMMSGVTVVISPLLALMYDQVKSLNAQGLKASMLSSMQSVDENSQTIAALHNGEIQFLYLSPERLNTNYTKEMLSRLKINYFVVDEAHCISEWGHEFREDYRYLSHLKDSFPDINICAFTATATSGVRDDIVKQLRLKNPLRLQGDIYRENLNISVKPRVGNGYAQLKSFLDERNGQSGIVYAFSRKSVEATAEYLRQTGYSALAYHAGMSPGERERAFDSFVLDETKIIVATIAFGMGIDKSNIRFVAHIYLPKSVENYYQEIGRAGRDSDDADVLLLYSASDTMQQRRFIEQSDDESLKSIMSRKLNSMYQYASSEECRHKQLALYFDDKIDSCDSSCDNCLEPEYEKTQITKEAQMLLSAIYRTKQMFGKTYIVDLLRGSKEQKILTNNHDSLSVYGIGKHYSKAQWLVVLDRLFELEAVGVNEYQGLVLTAISAKILQSKQSVFVKKERLQTKTKTLKKRVVEIVDYDIDMFEHLRELRQKIAKEAAVPPYIVFSDKTLKELALSLPKTKEQMLLVNGVGEVKFERYGDRFLESIRGFGS